MTSAPTPQPAFRPEHLDILRLLVRGYGNAAIGRQLGVPLDTVRSRLRRIQVITGCCGRVQLAHAAGRNGWLEERPIGVLSLTPDMVQALLLLAFLVNADAPLGTLRKASAAVQAAHKARRAQR